MGSLMQMPKYEDYRDSGVEWLGAIPSSWGVKRMKYLYRDFSKKGMPNAELLSVTQDQGVVPRTWVENRMVMPSGNLESFKFIEIGDFAISLRSFEGGLEYCHYNGIISPAYTVLKRKLYNLEKRYYRALFKSHSFISELQTSIVGIREGKNISFQELSYSLMPIPPILEQTAIAAFLDRKTAQIDQVVAIKEKQIALLKERKQILIQNAVTCGLDPNIPMKDSGVGWIGKIPAHWEVKRLAIFGTFSKGGGFSKSDLTEDGVSAILYGDVYTQYEFIINKAVRKISSNVAGISIRIRRNDLLFTGSGETKEDIGKCVVYDSSEPAVAGGDIIIFRQKKTIHYFLLIV
jgi:type I restriction enzyme S subunit